MTSATPVSLADSGSGSDSVSVSATVPLADSGAGTDSAVAGPLFPSNPLGTKVELLLNGTWTDITDYVYSRDVISITSGRQNEASAINPAQATLALDNRTGRFSPKNTSGTYYPFITRNTQLRIHVQSTTASSGYEGYRFWGEVSSWPPQSDPSQKDIFVTVTASGYWRRLQQGSTIGSAIKRYYQSLPMSQQPVSYWSCEDGTSSSSFASGVSGGSAMTWTGSPSLASSTAFGGSDALPQLNGSAWTGPAGSNNVTPSPAIYSTPGTYTWWCPGDVTSLTSAEGFGSGAGGSPPGSNGGQAAGGAEYAKITSVAVTPGAGYTFTVPAGGAQGQDGAAMVFTADASTLTAHGGKADGTAGTGSTNPTHYDGGAGAAGGSGSGAGGGGGGSSAGTGSAGNPGTAGQSNGTAGTGGAAPTGGAAGGDGGTFISGDACVDTLTEIYTRRGWLRFDQVVPGDETLAIDAAASEPAWTPVLAVNVHPGRHAMTVLSSEHLSACVTAEHRWLVRPAEGGWAWRETKDLLDSDQVPLGHRELVAIGSCERSEVTVEGIIWCPTTGAGNWLARRDGHGYYIGNKPS